jgi:hypothetical protein
MNEELTVWLAGVLRYSATITIQWALLMLLGTWCVKNVIREFFDQRSKHTEKK